MQWILLRYSCVSSKTDAQDKTKRATNGVMIMKKYALAATHISVLLALCGCKVDSKSEIFLTDAFDVASDQTKSMEINSEFRIEVSSKATCDEKREKFTEVMSRYFSSLTSLECRYVSGGSDYMAFMAKTPIINGNKVLPNNAFAGLSVASNASKSIVITAILDHDRFAALNKEISDISSMANMDLHDVSFDLNNDGRDTYIVGGASAFVNNKPMIITDATVSRREKLLIRLSDVAVAQLQQQGSVPLFMVKMSN